MMDPRRIFRSFMLIVSVLNGISPFVEAEDFEIRFSLPKIIMKLIIVDDVQIDQFKLELDKIVQLHLVNFYLDKLPADTEIINHDQFRSITLTSTIERVPVEVDTNSTSAMVSVLQSEFDGFGNFSISDDTADFSLLSKELINNTTDLRPITFDAFRQRLGFWQFADLIIANNFLDVTGIVQIVVDNIIVGEADLESDRQDDTSDSDTDTKDLSRLAIALIGVACLLVACIGGIGALIWYLRHREHQMEKKSMERRELSKQTRIKCLGNSSGSPLNSISSKGDESLMHGNTTTTASFLPERIERITSVPSIPSLQMQLESQSKKDISSASLLDSIATESTNLEFEMTNVRKKAHPNTNQDDEDESEFYSVQSASERDENIAILQDSQPNANAIVNQYEHRKIKRNDRMSIGNGPMILKPAIKNSHEGQQYVKDTTRKYISYSNSFTSSTHASPRTTKKLGIKQKMNHISGNPTTSLSTKGGLYTNGSKSTMPPLSPSKASHTMKGKIIKSPTKKQSVHSSLGRYDDRHQKNEEDFDDGIMIGMSCSNLSFDIMDGSNSDQASISPLGKDKMINDDNDACASTIGSNQNSLQFYFS